MDMLSPLENLYPDTGSEPVFFQPSTVQASDTLPVSQSARNVLPLDQQEEDKVSEQED